MENNIINLEILTKPLPTNGSLKDAIIARFNEVFGGCWSFRIIEHHIRENEVIVLGELAAREAIRQQFGRAIITLNSDMLTPPSMAEYLAKASDDALIQCAGAFGIPKGNTAETQLPSDSSRPSQNESPVPGNGNGSRKITNRQLAALFGLGKSQGMSQNDVISLTKERYNREPMELTVTEASELIGELKSST